MRKKKRRIMGRISKGPYEKIKDRLDLQRGVDYIVKESIRLCTDKGITRVAYYRPFPPLRLWYAIDRNNLRVIYKNSEERIIYCSKLP